MRLTAELDTNRLTFTITDNQILIFAFEYEGDLNHKKNEYTAKVERARQAIKQSNVKREHKESVRVRKSKYVETAKSGERRYGRDGDTSNIFEGFHDTKTPEERLIDEYSELCRKEIVVHNR